MALLSFVDSAPRAYRLKASNAYLTFSTAAGTSPVLGVWSIDQIGLHSYSKPFPLAEMVAEFVVGWLLVVFSAFIVIYAFNVGCSLWGFFSCKRAAAASDGKIQYYYTYYGILPALRGAFYVYFIVFLSWCFRFYDPPPKKKEKPPAPTEEQQQAAIEKAVLDQMSSSNEFAKWRAAKEGDVK